VLISKDLNDAINEQVGHELHASHQYVNIASYFESIPLKKLAAMFYKQAEEERSHAMKFIKYVVDAGGEVKIPAVAAPVPTFKTVEEAVKLSLDWELEVTRRINALMDIAIAQKDYIAQDMLRWFVTEQLEEVSTMDNLLKLVKLAGERSLIMIEGYLSHSD
jgi:ferritin